MTASVYRYSSQECPRHGRRFCRDNDCRAERNRLDLAAHSRRTDAYPGAVPQQRHDTERP